MRRDRIVSQDRVMLLQQVANAEHGQAAEDQDRDQDQIQYLAIRNPEGEQQSRDDGANRQHDEAWRERKQQRFHGIPQADSAELFLPAAD